MERFYISTYVAILAIFLGLGQMFSAMLNMYEASFEIACPATGDVPSDEFFFTRLYHVVYPDVDPSFVTITVQDNLFHDTVILSDGYTELAVARSIQRGGLLKPKTALGLGLGYHQLDFDEPKLKSMSITLDPCGRAQNDKEQIGLIRSIGKDLNDSKLAGVSGG
jgi:hypothetical protein